MKTLNTETEYLLFHIIDFEKINIKSLPGIIISFAIPRKVQMDDSEVFSRNYISI